MIYFDHSRLQFWCICSHPLCQARQREKAPLRKRHLITTYFILYFPLPGVHTFFGANLVIAGAFAEWNKAVDDVIPLRRGTIWTWKHLYPEWRGGRARLARSVVDKGFPFAMWLGMKRWKWAKFWLSMITCQKLFQFRSHFDVRLLCRALHQTSPGCKTTHATREISSSRAWMYCLHFSGLLN